MRMSAGSMRNRPGAGVTLPMFDYQEKEENRVEATALMLVLCLFLVRNALFAFAHRLQWETGSEA